MKYLAVICFALAAFGVLGVSSAANQPLAGDPDPSFGSGGSVSDTRGSVEGLAVQSDGKVIVSGRDAQGFLLARYLPNGALDPSFGDGGYVETAFPANGDASAVAVQPDGKIVVAGSDDPVDGTAFSQFVLARYNPDGSLDPSFGLDGIATTVVPSPAGQLPDAAANALAILPDGDLLAGGSTAWHDGLGDEASQFALVRYTPRGALDPTFGTGGIVRSGESSYSSLDGLTVQPDGRIVAAGSGLSGGVCGHCSPPVDTMEVVRYEPDGSLDTAGDRTTDPKLRYDGGPVTLQADKIVVAGSTHRNHPVLARFKPGGGLDKTFADHGFEVIRSVSARPSAVLTQSDGKILVAATNLNVELGNPTAVIRLLPNGRLDPTFGRGGIAWLGDEARALALQTDGKILAGGETGDNGTVSRLLGGDNCAVPDVRGKTVTTADSRLESSYCRRGRISKRFSSGVARGRVIATAPKRGTRLPRDAEVDLVVSLGTRGWRP